MESSPLNYSVRTFRAPSMPEALAAVKRELGPDAVILGTRALPATALQALARRQQVEIIAAPPGAHSPRVTLPTRHSERSAESGRAIRHSERSEGSSPPRGKPRALSAAPPSTPAAPTVAPDLYPHFVRLVQNDVAEDIARRLLEDAAARAVQGRIPPADAIRAALRACVARLVSAGSSAAPTHAGPRRIALVGPSGSGKSTTLAKLGALFHLKHRQRVAFLSLDMHRVDAHEQLRKYAEALEIPLHTAQTLAEVKHVVKTAAAFDLLLIDTPGVGLREQARFARVATLVRAAAPDEVHLVLPASLAPPVQDRIAHSFEPLGVSKLVLTRLDDVVGVGVILSVAEHLHLPVAYWTAGQSVPHDLQEVSGGNLADALCRAIEA